MVKQLHKLAAWIDRLNERVGEGVSWLNAALIFLVCFDVVTRYLFSDTAAWIAELEWHLFALIFLLGAGYAWKHDRHVRVDLFYTHFTAKNKAMVDSLGAIFFLIPWCLLLLVYSFEYALSSFRIRETSPDPGGLPMLYLIKFAVCIGLFLLLLQAIAKLIRDLTVWLGPDTREEPQ